LCCLLLLAFLLSNALAQLWKGMIRTSQYKLLSGKTVHMEFLPVWSLSVGVKMEGCVVHKEFLPGAVCGIGG